MKLYLCSLILTSLIPALGFWGGGLRPPICQTTSEKVGQTTLLVSQSRQSPSAKYFCSRSNPDFPYHKTHSTSWSQSTQRCSIPNPMTPPISLSLSSSVVSGPHTRPLLIKSMQWPIWASVEWKLRLSGSKTALSQAATRPSYNTQSSRFACLALWPWL